MFDKNNKNALLDEHLTDVLDETTLVDSYLWARAVIFLVIGVLIGGVSVSFRPYFNDGTHYEAIAALIVLIGINLGLLRYFLRHRKKRYLLAYGLSVCAIWSGYTIGWLSLAVYFLDDVIMMAGIFALVNLAIGYFSLFCFSK